jgi:hypothetical protein
MKASFRKQEQPADLLLQSGSQHVSPDFAHEVSRSALADEEAYRFVWDSSFDGLASVYIGRSGEVVTLRARRSIFSFAADPVAEHILQLSPDQWDNFQVAAANFWSLDRFSEQPAGLDGAQWSIEGRREGIYHAVHRWSPSDSVRELGEVFVGLAGAPLATVHLY